MLGALELKEERELQRIDRQPNIRNKGMTIQMPPLNTTFIEAHQELAKTIREAKEHGDAHLRTKVAQHPDY